MATTEYGFTFGPAEVTRLHSDPKYGVAIEVKGKRGALVVRVTPSGMVKLEKQDN
jgi:hypothetical protein